MLARQTSLVLSPYSKIFDVVVPANHRLRLLKSQIDFSFIRKEVKDNYWPKGDCPWRADAAA